MRLLCPCRSWSQRTKPGQGTASEAPPGGSPRTTQNESSTCSSARKDLESGIESGHLSVDSSKLKDVSVVVTSEDTLKSGYRPHRPGQEEIHREPKARNPSDLIALNELIPESKTSVNIDQTECRAITISQLVAILDYVKRHCTEESWTSSNPGTPDLLLDPQQINLYDLVFWVIKPATKRDQCSYVELIATGQQSPNWFVSHWWGEPVAAFVACLQGHTRDRGLPPDTTYWVCAYANNQWQISAEVADDPARSSFRRAIDRAVGTLTVLDESAVTYTRVWCAYEIFVSLTATRESGKYLYDVYTTRPDGVSVGLADGCTMMDFDSSRWKNIRESSFPVHLATKALDTRVEEANASVDTDRRHILNAIAAEEDLNGTPKSHPGYDRINRALRGRFASVSLALALSGGANKEVVEQYGQAMLESGLKDMDLDFSLSKDPEVALEVIQMFLPDSLQRLALTWYNPALGPRVGEAMAGALRKLPSLAYLKIDVLSAAVNGGCDNLVEVVTGLAKLERLELWFNQNVISSRCLQHLASHIKDLRNLRTLHIDFESSNVESNAALAFASACKGLPLLKNLTIGLRGNKLVADDKVELMKLQQGFKDAREPVQASIYVD